MKDILKGFDYEVIDLQSKEKQNKVEQSEKEDSYEIPWKDDKKNISEPKKETQTSQEIEKDNKTNEKTKSKDTDRHKLEKTGESRIREYASIKWEPHPLPKSTPPYEMSYIESGIYSLPDIEDYLNVFKEKIIPELQREYSLEKRVKIIETYLQDRYWTKIRDGILKDIENTKEPNKEVIEIQKKALNKVSASEYSVIGCNPKILKHSLMAILEIDRYKEMSKELQGSNLTINVPSSRVTLILDTGYVCEEEPCYIAYNPGGDSKGATEFYGDVAIEVEPYILKDCTVTDGDSFNTTSVIPVIESLDHLNDLYLLRCCMAKSEELENLDMNWKNYWRNDSGGDVPLEIQYHHPAIESSRLRYLGETDL